MKIRMALMIAAAFALAGCETFKGMKQDIDHHFDRHFGGDETVVTQDLPANSSVYYVCRNGDHVSAMYGDGGEPARITAGGVTVAMQPEQAPFGAKFRAPDNTTFWVNGQDVLLEWENGEMLFCRQEGK
jgi:predicted small secreted protein